MGQNYGKCQVCARRSKFESEKPSKNPLTAGSPSDSTDVGVPDTSPTIDGPVCKEGEETTLKTETAPKKLKSGREGASEQPLLTPVRSIPEAPARSSVRLAPKARKTKSVRLSTNVAALPEGPPKSPREPEDGTVQMCSLDDSEDDEMDWYNDGENGHGEDLHAGMPRGTLDNLFPPDYNTTRSASVMWWHDDRKSGLLTEEDLVAGTVVPLDQAPEVHNMSIGKESVDWTDCTFRKSAVLLPEEA
uniref:Uncharacterized protein n=1 Tax=Noctiluca scintillans TaxID=2966 RepID=A0A7S1FFZ7_NOCSC